MFEELRQSIRHFPDKPGVYLMKNEQDHIIYIGKATSLKKRVTSYFTGNKDPKTRVLVGKIHAIDHIATGNEYEALLLENNLIKKWQPRYNINLKDGKSYPVIRITAEDFPRIFRTRRIFDDGSDYYGPYPSVHQLDTYIDVIEKLYPLRKCKGPLKKREYPCLYYHIHRCSAPCTGNASKDEYNETVGAIKKLLSGNSKEMVKTLTGNMESAVTELKFEQAAEYRDAIQAVKETAAAQEVQDFNFDVRDYVAAVEKEHLCSFIVFQMRGGKLMGRDLYRTEHYGDFPDAYYQFIVQYYGDRAAVPDALFVSDLVDTELISQYFLREKERRIEVKIPQRGRHRSILRMARENGLLDMDQRMRKRRNTEALEELKMALDLDHVPRRIEGFDISQLSGKHPVASMVSFYDGLPDKKNYRHYHVKTLDGAIDDYGSMREIVARRYTRILNEQLEQPDLILVDGGKGQVSAAKSVLDALGLAHITLAGLAKRQEEIFLPGRDKPYELPDTSSALKVLQRVRDESHRFATSFNKRLRQKDVKFTSLTEVPGIGEVRSRKLIEKYESLEAIAKAEPCELAALLGVNNEKAEGMANRLRKLG
ncbi:MAG: excinuclease ABC subunit C [Spirochaetales bacterium]|nr:excinuclease ABC subunit C [Spirochaetales bacterium]